MAVVASATVIKPAAMTHVRYKRSSAMAIPQFLCRVPYTRRRLGGWAACADCARRRRAPVPFRHRRSAVRLITMQAHPAEGVRFESDCVEKLENRGATKISQM